MASSFAMRCIGGTITLVSSLPTVRYARPRGGADLSAGASRYENETLSSHQSDGEPIQYLEKVAGA